MCHEHVRHAAALPQVSVEAEPAPTRTVIDMPERRIAAEFGWQHSTSLDPAAIDAVCGYLRACQSLRSVVRPRFRVAEPWKDRSRAV
jgi:hypothetical protein